MKLIKPPYTLRDVLTIVVVLFITLAIPLTVFIVFEDLNFTGNAAVNTKIWFEAEDGSLMAPMTASSDTNASAGKYISTSVTNTALNKSKIQIAGVYDSTTKTFTENFDGAPSSPVNLGGIAGKNILPDWDIQVHSRDNGTWGDNSLQSMDAQHDSMCNPPPSTHENHSYEGAVYNCKNHVMTAIWASGYGLISLTPNHMADFTNGSAVIEWEQSTERMSSRDWPDVWITPFADATPLPFDIGVVDLQGVPKRGVHLFAGANQNSWQGYTINDFTETGLPSIWWVGMHEGITDGTNQAAVRQKFRITISRTHLKMERLASSTATAFVWVDSDMSDLGWTQGVVEFAHHSYNPTKEGAGVPATWHWDAVSISPAVPFTIIHGDKRMINQTGQSINFDQPAPANSFLRFSAIGKISYSLNNGSTYIAATKQLFTGAVDHIAPYYIPIPASTQKVTFKFENDDWYNCDTWGCIAKDFSFFSTTVLGSPPPPPPPADTTPPSVAITAPANNANVSGNVNVTATASDTSGISLVEFYIDGTNMTNLVTGTGPYQLALNSATLFDGSHTVLVKAYDNNGNSAQTTITITTANNNPSLPVNTGSASYNFTIGTAGNYTVWTRMLAANSNSDSFWLKMDNQPAVKVGDGNIAYNSYGWLNHINGDLSQKISFNLTVGTHTLQFVGRESGARIDRILVTNDLAYFPTGKDGSGDQPAPDTQVPAVSVTSPTNATTVFNQVSFAATATDNVSVTKVEFYID